MLEPVSVTIHPSQFPDAVQRDLLESLRSRQVNHKFHYDSLKQTQKWLALHEAYSPSRTDPDCVTTYEAGFRAVASRIAAPSVHLIGLGCGGGQKDTRLLHLLRDAGKELFYTPLDVSVPMVLVAREQALTAVPGDHCFPFVCDLATARDLATALGSRAPADGAQLITCFGMSPNFEPDILLRSLAGLWRSPHVRGEDILLISANLAPGVDYARGVQRILPLYDNAMTRDWLMTFLSDIGVRSDDGKMSFVIEDAPDGNKLKRIAAWFEFAKSGIVRIGSEEFHFHPGAKIRLFFSYRFTSGLLRQMLATGGLEVRDQWITKSEEEGVFLVSGH
jgi:uncharacterized SAM-dependent methyltransferase